MIRNTHSEEEIKVLLCFIRHDNKFLFLKRGAVVDDYKNCWSPLAGLIDDDKPLAEKVAEEVNEELGIAQNDIQEIQNIEVYRFQDAQTGKRLVRHLSLVTLAHSSIRLDWEHTDYQWIAPGETLPEPTTPGLWKDFEKVQRWILQYIECR